MVQVLRANVNGMLSHNDSDELDEKGRQSRVSRLKTKFEFYHRFFLGVYLKTVVLYRIFLLLM